MILILSYILSFLASILPLAFSIGQNLEYEYTFLALFSLYGCFILTAFLIPQKNLKNFLSQVKRESGKYFFAIFVGNPLAFLVVPSFLFLSKTFSLLRIPTFIKNSNLY